MIPDKRGKVTTLVVLDLFVLHVDSGSIPAVCSIMCTLRVDHEP